MMKKILSAILFFPLVAFAQNQGDDLSLGAGGTSMIARVNEAGTNIASADGKANYVAVNKAGRLIVASGSGASDLGKAEDTAHTSGDTGVMCLGVVNTSISSFTSTQGDYSPRAVNQYGFAFMDINVAGSSNANNNPFRLEDAVAGEGSAGTVLLSAREDVAANNTSGNGDLAFVKSGPTGYVYVDTAYRGTVTYTNPSIANASSVTALAANTSRRGYRIQNNSAANICCSESGATLTNITGTSCNVIVPAGYLESKPNVVSTSAITCYQTSGGAITTVTVAEWQ